MIKTFRGLLADGGQNKIRLTTMKGKIGYRIVKFQIFPGDPGTQHYEATIKIYKIFQSTVDNTVDFSDGNLLGAAYYQDDNAKHYSSSTEIIFDVEIFNQDIFVTYIGTDSAISPMNYYIEIETMPLSDNAAAVSTLRDIRLNPAPE